MTRKQHVLDDFSSLARAAIIKWIRVLLLRSKSLTYTVTKLIPLLSLTRPSLSNILVQIGIEEEGRRALAVIADFLNHSSFQTINLVDVGCYKGDFLEEFRSLVRRRIFSIGIDPVSHHHIVPYSVFVETAITNEPEGVYDFFVCNDPTFSSFKRTIASNVTRNIKTSVVRTVNAVHLSTIIERFKMENEIIHFLKIDAQGSDLEVFLSLGKYVKNCLFVQLETIHSKDKSAVLYESQTIFEEEKPIIERLGFELFACIDYSRMGSPEADVIFVNKEIIRANRRARWKRK
jgi:hypothetical protein